MPTRIIYKRRKEKERRLAQLLFIAAAVLAIRVGGAGIAACFTAIGHLVAVQRSELPEFTWKKWYPRVDFDWDEVTPVGLKWNDGRCDTHLGNMCRASIAAASRYRGCSSSRR